ncbi:MAG: hypothetical protein ACI8P7_001113 [Candidatus Azotimanducaceae bacterium]|jgi:hypothetical protein
MNKTKNLLSVTAVILLVIVSCKEKKDEKTTTKEELATYAKQKVNATCLAKPDWFKIDPTTENRKTLPPAEGKTSVFGNNDSVTNCDFHQWSWQKFLWLTNDVSGNPLFIENLIQVNTQCDSSGFSKEKIILSDHKQATGNILKTNKSFSIDNTSHDVYYSIHVDNSLYEDIQKYSKMDISEYKDSSYQVGALELKVAWVNKNAIRNADTSSYFITNGSINSADTRIALLGMHVVGIVYNHPEFVWATFEHHDMAPQYNWTDTRDKDIPVTSSTNMLFFDSLATGHAQNLWSTSDSVNVFNVNKFGVPIQAHKDSDTSFMVTSQSGAQNFNNINSINNDVSRLFKSNDSTDIWSNYFYNGSIWIDNKNTTDTATLVLSRILNTLGDTLGKVDSTKLPRGSVAAYNITMETYEQIGLFTKVDIHSQNLVNVANCFSCHVSEGSPITISHIFKQAIHKQNGLTVKEAKAKTLQELKAYIKGFKKE